MACGAETPQAGPVVLQPGTVDLIYANNVLEHVPDLPRLMENCLDLLKTGGQFLIEVPFELALTAWQGPTPRSSPEMNVHGCTTTDWFWYLGWFEHRFNVDQFAYLDDALKECERPRCVHACALLTKVETTLKERNNSARVMRPDFCLPDDIDE